MDAEGRVLSTTVFCDDIILNEMLCGIPQS